MNKLLPLDVINTPKFKRKFWLNVDRIGKTDEECWIYNKRVSGYVPRIYLNDSNYNCSRVSYYLGHNLDPEDLLVCHECDESLCMNFNHMFLGTNLDNIKDCVSKGRNSKGENHNFAKLTNEKVILIRELYKTKEYTQRLLASEFNISLGMINHIVNNKNWKHLLNEETNE